jgi:hypothetical protein
MTRFDRLVLELGHGAADPETMRQAAAFARLLDAELHALFVEDETLLHASALPFSREISPLSYQWRPLEQDRLEAELRAAADQARRHLEAVALAIGVRRGFEVCRGDLASHVTETCAASDIVVVASPRGMGTRGMHGFRRLHETAGLSAAAVLHLPPDAGRAHGPVVAVVTGMDDSSLGVARLIAAQGKERLLVLAGVAGDDASVRIIPGTTPPDIVAALSDTRERLIVLTRDASRDGAGFELAITRGVPVLVVEAV